MRGVGINHRGGPLISVENDRKSILVTTSTFSSDSQEGGSRGVYNLCKALAHNFKIFVLAPHARGLRKEESIQDLNVIRYQYFFERWQKLSYGAGILPNLKNNYWLFFQVPFFLFFQLVAVLKVIKKNHPDLIHANWAFPQGFIAYVASLLVKIPYIITVRGSDIQAINNYCYRLIVKQALKKSRWIVATSPALAQDVVSIYKVSPEKVKIITSGVDLKLFSKRPGTKTEVKKSSKTGNKFILFVGRITPVKQLDVLLKALPGIISRFPQTELLVAGEGPLMSEMKDLAQKLGVEESVEFLGNVSQQKLVSYYNNCDIYALVSRNEGTPGSLMEAMAIGTAIVVSNYRGVDYAIRNYKNGLVVPVGDVGKTAEAICKLLTDDLLRQRLGAQAQQDAKKFNIESVINKYQEIYQTISS